MTAEGLVGAAFSIVYGRLLRGEPEPLTGLLGELMGMIVLPYLGPAAARKEHARAAPVTVPVPGISGTQAGILVGDGHGRRRSAGGSADAPDLPHRARSLGAVADSPGVSNRAHR